MRWQVNRLIPTLLETQTPVVSVVRGWAVGLGLNIALAADFAVVADDARLWEPFIDFGFTPDTGAAWLLPRLVGVARGPATCCCSAASCPARKRPAGDWCTVRCRRTSSTRQPAELVATLPAPRRQSQSGLTKLLIHRGLTLDLDRHLADEAFAMELSSRSEDFRDYQRSLAEKRDPDFKGR